MLDKIDIFSRERDTINLIQDKEGHWTIGERVQQESGIGNIEPLIIHIGEPHRYHFSIDEKLDLHHPNIGIIGIGDSQRELIDVLQHIVAEEGHRKVIIVGACPKVVERKEVTLGDFADMLIEQTKQEIFLITNTLERVEDIELKIEENKTFNQKYARHQHSFHNQKPGGPKGQFARRGRK